MTNKQTQVATNKTKGSVEPAPQKVVTFAELWDAYPSDSHPYKDPKTGEPPPNFDNQCAIRLSVALHNVGVEMKSFNGKGKIRLDGKNTAVLAAEMADWLKVKQFPGLGRPELITGQDWKEKVKNRTGIIAFKDYWIRHGQSRPTGGHIDLWNGSRTTITMNADSIGAVVGRYIGIDSISRLYSNLGGAREILFF